MTSRGRWAVLGLFALAGCMAFPAAAAARWTAFAQLGLPHSYEPGAEVVSNARGDAVAVFVERSWVAVARARAHGPFGRRIRIARGGSDPKVAIDERGTALISFAYFDRTEGEYPEDRGDRCCVGAKVAVWRRGRSRPTAPRAVTRRGVTAEVDAVAARQGRRGVLYTEFAGYRMPSDPVRFAPVRRDGRLGQARVIAGNGLSGATLQFSGGRAIAGLTRPVGTRETALLTAQQRSSGAFDPARPFARVPAQAGYSLQFVEDRRGGQVVAWWEGQRPQVRLTIGRVSRRGALRTDELALAEPLSALGRPAVSPDGWIVVPYGRLVGLRRDERVDVVSRSPRGQLVRTALAGSFGVDALAAAVTRGGTGVVATRRSGATAAIVDQVFPLRAGRPLAAGSLTRPPHGYAAIGPAVTANPVDRARVLLSTPTRLLAARWR